jgi:hypothetical protein
MSSKMKNQAGGGVLTHSAVYRVASPSPIKNFHRPASNFAGINSPTQFKSREGHSKLGNTKNTALRNTVGGSEKVWEVGNMKNLIGDKSRVGDGQLGKITNRLLLTTSNVDERVKTERGLTVKEGVLGHDFKRK